jgi:hypothetical protein
MPVVQGDIRSVVTGSRSPTLKPGLIMNAHAVHTWKACWLINSH